MTVQTILYITAQLMGTRRYFSWTMYPDIWYSRIQRRVLESMNSFKDVEAYVKFYPNDMVKNPNKDLVKSELTHIDILEESLTEILMKRNFDLIVTEACATTLLEVLCTKSQILCFFPKDYVKIEKEFVNLLDKRVFFSNSESEYIESLNSFMRDGFIVKKGLNDEFLFKFGLSSIENISARVEKEYINQIILDDTAFNFCNPEVSS